MHQIRSASWLPRGLSIGVAIIIVLIPFQAVLTVGLSQLVGHYTLLRLWKELLLILFALSASCMFIRRPSLRRQLTSDPLFWLIAGYLLIQVVWGVVAYATHQVTALALGYGWVSDTRYLLFFVVVWIVTTAAGLSRQHWPRLILWPAAIVTIFGLLQYFVLPYDFLKHLGYGAATIFPYEDINHNVHYIRIISTLRGANPLGAYLVVILSLLGARLFAWRQPFRHKRALIVSLLLVVASVAALVLSFSRAAWIGAVLSLTTLLWAHIETRAARLIGATSLLVAVVLIGSGVLFFRQNSLFQNIFFHTEARSSIPTTSDQGHVSALVTGFHDIVREPFGRGPGTAGPASVYNSGHPLRIAEDYFVQVDQEVGWLGLVVFLAIIVLVGRLLWHRRHDSLALGLLAALVGVSFINLLSHAWADDTLAYIWWGLAAIAVARPAEPSSVVDESASEG